MNVTDLLKLLSEEILTQEDSVDKDGVITMSTKDETIETIHQWEEYEKWEDEKEEKLPDWAGGEPFKSAATGVSVFDQKVIHQLQDVVKQYKLKLHDVTSTNRILDFKLKDEVKRHRTTKDNLSVIIRNLQQELETKSIRLEELQKIHNRVASRFKTEED